MPAMRPTMGPMPATVHLALPLVLPADADGGGVGVYSKVLASVRWTLVGCSAPGCRRVVAVPRVIKRAF